ncbi:hypothetical protein [Pelagibius sp. Alg239-R121]|uniref:hypothetical protein n=1 Tax=Pelagibius sp. Alg239-R121 TaxID=2993448 RepID=UPI0024A71983|nr:hypothetical protein [Pelagibius sp. Alg239-R121]
MHALLIFETLKKILFASTAIAVWSAILSIFVSSGLLWWLLPDAFKKQSSMQLQSHLMQPEEVFNDTLVIGDSLFFQRLSIKQPVQKIEINSFDPYDATFSLEQIEKLKEVRGIEANYCRVFIQFSPYFLVRMTSRGVNQNVNYFSDLSSTSSLFWPSKLTKRFFYIIEEFSVWLGNAKPTGAADRPSHFPVQLSNVDENLENWGRLFERIKVVQLPVTLVQDRAGSDYSTASDVLEYFDTQFPQEIAHGKYGAPNLQLVGIETAQQELANGCETKKN